MYITSELFGSHDRRNESASTTTQDWNTIMADTTPTNGLGKRKRERDADEGPSSTYTTGFFAQAAMAAKGGARRSAARLDGARPIKQLKRLSPPKISLVKIPSHLMDTDVPSSFSSDPSHDHDAAITTRPAPVRTLSENDLSACHICHSAPKRKSELENYLQCQSCSKRACYICARTCSGECGKQLCSRCCAEIGKEGVTYCLGCLETDVNSG